MRRDDGCATVLAAGMVAVLVLLLALVVQLGAVVLGRHRAEHAADLAALAAATEGVRGQDVGCAAAGDVATRNGARLTGCTWSGWSVTVLAARPCGCPLTVSGPSVGRARAGPGDSSARTIAPGR